MIEKKFDPKKLERLNHPDRLKQTPPDLIWEKLGIKNPGVALDIGAGTGFFSIPLLEKMGPGSFVHALDISDIMVDWMKEHVAVPYPGIVPALMGESSIPLEDNTADLALLFNLYHELEEPRKMLQEIHRVLKPGGKLAILDWRAVEMLQGPPLEIRVSASQIEADLKFTNFETISMDHSLEMHDLLIADKK